MIKTIWILIIFAIILGITSFLPVVTELPLGIDSALVFFVGTIQSLIEVMPFLGVVWERILWALGISLLLLTWHFVKMAIDYIK